MKTSRVVVLKSAAELIARASTLISFPIMARYVGASGFGAYGQVNTVATFLVPFASLGLGGALMRYLSLRQWDRISARLVWRVVTVTTAASVIVGIAVWALAPHFAPLLLDRPDAPRLLRLGGVLVILGALEQIFLNALRAQGWLVQFVVLELAQVVLLVGAILVILPGGGDLEDVLIAAIVVKSVVLGANALIIGVKDQTPKSQNDAVESIRRMVAFGLPMSIAGLGFWLMGLGDRVVIGYHLTPSDLGRYGAVFALASLVALAGSPFYFPAYGRLVRAAHDADPGLMQAELSLFHRYIALSVVPAAGFLTVVIPDAVRILGGASFEVSTFFAGAMVLGFVTGQWNGLAHYVLAAKDRTVIYQNAWIACGLLNVGLNMLLVPRWGLNGAAIASAISFLILDTWLFVLANRLVRISTGYRWIVSVKSFAMALIAAVIVSPLLGRSSQPMVLLSGLVFVSVYLLGMVLWGEVGRHDLAVIKSMIKGGERRHPAAEDPVTDSLHPPTGY